MAFKRVVAGTIAAGGSGPPMISDVNQYAKALSGEEDVGTLSLAAAIVAPASAGTGVAATGAGLGIGAYTYAITYVTGHLRSNGTVEVVGETTASTTWAVTTTSGNQQVSLSSLPVSAATTVVSKRVYRTLVGGAQLKLVATISASATVYVDAIADASLGANVPVANTTGSKLSIATPTAANDAANKAYVDAHSTRTDNPHIVTPAQINAPALDVNNRVPHSITGTAASLWDSGTVGAANPILTRVNNGSLEFSTDGGLNWTAAGTPFGDIVVIAMIW